MDCATKQWGGVVADYYKPRWEVLKMQLEIALETGQAFIKTAYDKVVFNSVEKLFTLSNIRILRSLWVSELISS